MFTIFLLWLLVIFSHLRTIVSVTTLKYITDCIITAYILLILFILLHILLYYNAIIIITIVIVTMCKFTSTCVKWKKKKIKIIKIITPTRQQTVEID